MYVNIQLYGHILNFVYIGSLGLKFPSDISEIRYKWLYFDKSIWTEKCVRYVRNPIYPCPINTSCIVVSPWSICHETYTVNLRYNGYGYIGFRIYWICWSNFIEILSIISDFKLYYIVGNADRISLGAGYSKHSSRILKRDSNNSRFILEIRILKRCRTANLSCVASRAQVPVLTRDSDSLSHIV